MNISQAGITRTRPSGSVMSNDKQGGCLVFAVLSLESVGRGLRPFPYSSGAGGTNP